MTPIESEANRLRHRDSVKNAVTRPSLTRRNAGETACDTPGEEREGNAVSLSKRMNGLMGQEVADISNTETQSYARRSILEARVKPRILTLSAPALE